MLNTNLFKAAHKMARDIKSEYTNIDYKFQFGLCLSYLNKVEGEIKKMDLRIKSMEASKDFRDLRSWIIGYLKENEAITFFADEDCEEELKITVKKANKEQFTVALGDEALGKFFADELFYNFVAMCEVESLEDIPVFKPAVKQGGCYEK